MSKLQSMVKQFLSNNWNKLIPVFLAAFIWIMSYKGGWMLGWDNLVPEFNFSLNLKRTISSVWQGYRGVGHVDGMAQGANLVHVLTTWIMSLFIPAYLIRYVWHGLMYLLGVWGVQALFESIYQEKSSSTRISSLSVGILYAINLATVQNFYTPFEPFSAFFAFLPWLMFGFKKYIDEGTKKSLGLFSLLVFLSGP